MTSGLILSVKLHGRTVNKITLHCEAKTLPKFSDAQVLIAFLFTGHNASFIWTHVSHRVDVYLLG